MLALSVTACEAHGLIGSNVTAALHETTSGDGGQAGTSGGVALDGTTGGGGDTHGVARDPDPGGSTTEAFIFDVGPGDGPELCLAPLQSSCDHQNEDLWRAMGINCPGAAVVFDTQVIGHPSATAVFTGTLGTDDVYTPREGQQMVIMSTGRAADLPRTPVQLGCADPAMCPSTEFEPGVVLSALPAPIDTKAVDPKISCVEEPELVGTGDCSNTLDDQWEAGSGALDYVELRMSAKVPETADAFIYEFAFFSAEYPLFADGQSAWNDMYIAWLESERWTGNISFDAEGHPIALNGVFLDFLDADSELCRHPPCVAPELHGFAMQGHAGTRWLETVAPVEPGEDIEIVFALFDMTDASLDTAVLLDHVHWGCTDLPPITSPQG